MDAESAFHRNAKHHMGVRCPASLWRQIPTASSFPARLPVVSLPWCDVAQHGPTPHGCRFQVGRHFSVYDHRDGCFLTGICDGYDEVDVADRRRVSDFLLRYQALAVGKFYVTCREYYEVFQIVKK